MTYSELWKVLASMSMEQLSHPATVYLETSGKFCEVEYTDQNGKEFNADSVAKNQVVMNVKD